MAESGNGRRSMAFIGIAIIGFISMYMISGVGVYGYTVAAEFGAIESVGLIFTLESVLRLATMAIGGKIGDKLGRKKVFIFAVALYIICYLLCGFATNFWMFLILRSITGLAWGLYMINIVVLISDVFGQDQGPKYAGLYQGVTTVAMIIGAALAGIICAFNWRFQFYIPMIIMMIGFILCIVGLPKVEKSAEKIDMDGAGVFFTLLFFIPLSLALNWGNTYGWLSPLVLVLIVLAVIGIIGLLIAENRAVAPVLPFKLLKNKYFLSVFVISFVYSFVGGVSQYYPTFAQYVMGIDSVTTGFLTMPGLIIATILSIVFGRRAAKTSKYRGMTWAWVILTLISGIMLLFVGNFMVGTVMMSAYVYMMISLVPQGSANGIQQIVPYTYPMKVLKPELLGVGMAFMGIGGPIGTTLGSAAAGGLMNGAGGMMTLLYVPIVGAVIMLIFVFLFKDIEAGETI